MIHTFNGEEVKSEKWQWVAIYNDGTQLKQFADDGLFHQFKEINIDALKQWILTDGVRHLVVDISGTMKPIHFYRRLRSTDMGGDTIDESTIYCFGYEDTEQNQKVIQMVYPNDLIVSTSDVNTVLGVGQLDKVASIGGSDV